MYDDYRICIDNDHHHESRKTRVRAIIATECSDQSLDQVVTYVFSLQHFNCHLRDPKFWAKAPHYPQYKLLYHFNYHLVFVSKDLSKSPMTIIKDIQCPAKDLSKTLKNTL